MPILGRALPKVAVTRLRQDVKHPEPIDVTCGALTVTIADLVRRLIGKVIALSSLTSYRKVHAEKRAPSKT